MENKNIKVEYLERRSINKNKVVRFDTQIGDQEYFDHIFYNLYTKARCSIEAVLDKGNMATIIFCNGVLVKDINSNQNRIITNESVFQLRHQKRRFRGNDIYQGEYVDAGGEKVSVQMRIKPKY